MQSTLSKVRKLNPFEEFLEVGQEEFQCTIPCYWMTLESKEEITEEQIEETLRILFRNIDILHLCVKKENGGYWFYKMAEERINLRVINDKVLKKQSLEEIFAKETHTSFDSATGPLWRATYITNAETVNKSNFFISNIMLTFDHSIVDGFTCFSICNSFLKVLNDVIGGTVQNSYDFGHFSDGHETEELTEKRMEYLKKNPDYFDEIKAFHAKFDSQKLRVNEVYASNGTEKETKYIHGELDEETMKKILRVFKSKGITFHSGFSAAINWVLMELFIENGLTDEEIDLASEHPINMRRYWKKSTTIQLGSNVTIIKILSKTDKNIGANFWEYARNFNNSLKHGIESMQGIDGIITLTTSDFGGSQVDFSKMFDNYPPPKSYYCVTNMGDLTSTVQGKGEHASIKWLTRGASVQAMNNCIVPFIHTYEKRLLYCIAYTTHLVKGDIANRFVDKLIGKLKLLCNVQ